MQSRLLRHITVGALHLLPEEAIQATCFNEFDACDFSIGELSKQLFKNYIQSWLTTCTHGEHLEAQHAVRIARLQQLMQLFTPLSRTKECSMFLQHRIAVGPQLQLSQPKGKLVRAEGIAAGQLYIKQPVIQIGRFGTLAVKQKLLLRLFAQDAVLNTKLVVCQLDFLDTRQL